MKCTQMQSIDLRVARVEPARVVHEPAARIRRRHSAACRRRRAEEATQPEFWIARESNATKVVLDSRAIAEQNARLLHARSLGARPRENSGGADGRRGQSLDRKTLAISGRGHVRCRGPQARTVGLRRLDAQRRARVGAGEPAHALRARREARGPAHFPDAACAPTDSADDRDIDRFQESALFPGTPVVIAHESRDGNWWFIVSPLYAAWVEKRFIAEGAADEVFAYTRKSPYLVVTGATAKTVFTPERPEVSELQLDMGVRVPVLADWPAGQTRERSTSLYGARHRAARARAPTVRLRFTPALAAEDRGHVGRLSTAQSREPAAPGLQVPRRALRLGPFIQCARLQRLRVRCLPQLRCPAAAQHA